MKTDPNNDLFRQNVTLGLTKLKQQLQRQYERAYPELREIVRLVLEQEEAQAWNLSSFPHLVLPDLVELHIQKLNLQPAEIGSDVVARARVNEIPSDQPTLARCA
jgi:hypothetical protein